MAIEGRSDAKVGGRIRLGMVGGGYGTKGGLLWRQENLNQLFWSPLNEPTRIITRGGPDSGAVPGRITRVPSGHPEGYLEGFADIYSEVAASI